MRGHGVPTLQASIQKITVTPINTLFVDLDGVIRFWPQSDAPIELAHSLPIGSIKKAAFDPMLLTAAVTGEISDELWRTRIAQSLASVHGAPLAARAVEAWTLQCVEINHRALSLFHSCESIAMIVLVTNATSRLLHDLELLGIRDQFSIIVNSSEIGVAKPDALFFESALSLAQATPAQALFIDDTLGHVQAAERLGIRSHRYTSYDELEFFLKQSSLIDE